MSVLDCFRFAWHYRAYNFYYFCGMCFPSIERLVQLWGWKKCHDCYIVKMIPKQLIVNITLNSMLKK